MMRDPIVHFHIIPRYSSPVSMGGFTIEDADWPNPLRIRSVRSLLQLVKDEFKEWKKYRQLYE